MWETCQLRCNLIVTWNVIDGCYYCKAIEKSNCRQWSVSNVPSGLFAFCLDFFLQPQFNDERSVTHPSIWPAASAWLWKAGSFRLKQMDDRMHRERTFTSHAESLPFPRNLTKSMRWKIDVVILTSDPYCTLIWVAGGEDDCITAWPRLQRLRRLVGQGQLLLPARRE